MESARTHYARAVAHYDAGEHASARSEFERAYALSPAYQLLYNLGQIEQRLGHTSRARRYLEQYLAQGGACIAPERRLRVEAQLESLRADAPARPRAPRTAKAQRAEAQHAKAQRAEAQLAERPGHLARNVTWISAGALGVGALSAGVATWLAAERHAELRATPAAPGTAASARARLDRQRLLVQNLSWATDVLGAAALGATAFGLYLTLGADAEEAPGEPLSVSLGPGSIGLSGSF